MIGWRGPRGAKGREAWSGGGPRDGDGATGTTTRLLRCAEVTRQLATCMVDSTSAWPSIIPHPRPHLGCSGSVTRGPWHSSHPRQGNMAAEYYTTPMELSLPLIEWNQCLQSFLIEWNPWLVFTRQRAVENLQHYVQWILAANCAHKLLYLILHSQIKKQTGMNSEHV